MTGVSLSLFEVYVWQKHHLSWFPLNEQYKKFIKKWNTFIFSKKKKNPAAWGGYTEYYSSYLSVFLMLMYLEQNLKTRVSNYPQLERQENKLGNGFV